MLKKVIIVNGNQKFSMKKEKKFTENTEYEFIFSC